MNYTIKSAKPGYTPEADNTAVHNPAKDLQIKNPKAETFASKTISKSIPYETAQPAWTTQSATKPKVPLPKSKPSLNDGAKVKKELDKVAARDFSKNPYKEVDATQANIFRGLLPVPDNAAQMLAKVAFKDARMNNESLDDAQKIILWNTIQNAKRRTGKLNSGTEYEDYGNQGFGTSEEFNTWFNKGGINAVNGIGNSLFNPGFKMASTIGRGRYWTDPKDPNTVYYTDVYDWNSSEKNFKGGESGPTAYQNLRNSVRNHEDKHLNAEKNDNYRMNFKLDKKEIDAIRAKLAAQESEQELIRQNLPKNEIGGILNQTTMKYQIKKAQRGTTLLPSQSPIANHGETILTKNWADTKPSFRVPINGQVPSGTVAKMKADRLAIQNQSAAPAAPAAKTTNYKINSGDTLTSIAKKHGVSLQDLAKANNLSGDQMNRINSGKQLVIPENTKAPTTSTSTSTSTTSKKSTTSKSNTTKPSVATNQKPTSKTNSSQKPTAKPAGSVRTDGSYKANYPAPAPKQSIPYETKNPWQNTTKSQAKPQAQSPVTKTSTNTPANDIYNRFSPVHAPQPLPQPKITLGQNDGGLRVSNGISISPINPTLRTPAPAPVAPTPTPVPAPAPVSKDQQILQERQQRINTSMEARNKPFSAQQLADESGAIGDKLRIFPNDPNSFIDEWLNPGVLVGDMASKLGRMPLNIQQGNYWDAARGVLDPLVLGAAAKYFKPTTTYLPAGIPGQRVIASGQKLLPR